MFKRVEDFFTKRVLPVYMGVGGTAFFVQLYYEELKLVIDQTIIFILFLFAQSLLIAISINLVSWVENRGYYIIKELVRRIKLKEVDNVEYCWALDQDYAIGSPAPIDLKNVLQSIKESDYSYKFMYNAKFGRWIAICDNPPIDKLCSGIRWNQVVN